MSKPLPKPLPRVSAGHYAAAEPRAAKIRYRLKGESDGPIYQGQRILVPCATCGGGAITLAQGARGGSA